MRKPIVFTKVIKQHNYAPGFYEVINESTI